MPARPFRIGRSRTGLGVFATKPIKRRVRLAEYKGPRLDMAAAERAETRGNRYLFEVNSRWTIDGKARSNLARYFNHSCRPNTDVTIQGGRVFIYTLRAIEPGEEITYNYGKDYLTNVIGKSRCKCVRCRRRRAKRARELRAEKRNGASRTPVRKTKVAKRKRRKG